jgi:hypothetical protein
MVTELNKLAAALYSMELPAAPRAAETRQNLLERITDTFPQVEYAGQGRGRIVLWLPSPPHRPLTEMEEEHTHDGIVVKFAYNANPNNNGRKQNRTEATIWESGSPVISKESLAPVFETGPENKWLIMPYRDLIPSAARFEEAMIEKFGELPTGDLCAKDSWGLAGDGSVECCDYGRCPTHNSSKQTTGGKTNANVTI